jgi:hypothetical protein
MHIRIAKAAIVRMKRNKLNLQAQATAVKGLKAQACTERYSVTNSSNIFPTLSKHIRASPWNADNEPR